MADASEVHNEVSGTVIGPVVQAATVGELHVHPARRELVIARQLPAAQGLFVGRSAELAALTAAVDDGAGQAATMVISAIGGTGGIGKTWLAVHWAHQHLDRFPDGQLFVDLRGFSGFGEPMPLAAAVRGFLDALGVDPAAIPVDLDAQAALYRSLIAGRRMLVVLDNARDTGQVVALLPGSPSCTVIVTSRNRLAGLVTAHSAHPIMVDVLGQSEARDLLDRRLGPARLGAEPDAVAEVLVWCAGLPLALSIVASRAVLHPRISLAALAAQLRDTATRLGALDAGDPVASLQAVFSWSYAALTSRQATVFALLGLAPGLDISVDAVASLAGLPAARADQSLRVLERTSLLEQHAPDRYRMHDLVRLYAADRARQDQGEQKQLQALRRLLDFYLHTAFAADHLLRPSRVPIELEAPVSGASSRPLADEAAAFAWFDGEHSNLLAAQRLAAQHGWHRAVWQLAWILDSFHTRRGHLRDRIVAWQSGLNAAEHLNDPVAQARSHRLLGDACGRTGQHAQALEHLRKALALAQDAADLLSQAHTHQAFTMAWERQGDDQRALEHATCALELYRALGDPAWEATALNAVGWYQARLGHYDQARISCEAALELLRRHRDHYGEAAALDSLGYIAHATGRHVQALDHYRRALELRRDVGDTYNEPDTLDGLGRSHAALGQHDQARDAWRQSLTLYQAQDRTADADRIRQHLATLDDNPDVSEY